MIVKFFSRANCPLCVEGLQTLKLVQEDVPFEIDMIDIEQDDFIHEKYMLMIPVVEKDGVVIQYGHLDYATLMEQLGS
ncbi:glutaredoxin family protein [Lysinibacillus irui]|uniref:Glutaredoxin family protein n=1 Tax=Lysinibacillus irui TaxID=2998077 RepID=A0AAJ5USN1_9BACI|nr:MULTISPECIES: glutaredoxin family protein [Lysinibacillus]MEA0553621.1 glutaredoxin family protein [Lysinibacillus irui]MEA0564432.1 glutaredoxin family protein [Lysinibacillus irui]MEA0976005.1 glutaredoxin family protein [Lysinibacillus irui]MEA1042159.1 glutaredoxin family protein [Lysinibacillus irui]WDV06189.1 glutaredoxin family protein [Lysinibacillus irui]